VATPSSARPWRFGLRQPAAIPSADLAPLRSAVARTRATRILLALLLLASFLAAFLVARGLRVREGGVLPGGGGGVIVVDMSASVGEIANRRTATVFENAVNADEPTGLVLFSDSAYELVPPRTPGSVLRPILRYFTPRPLTAAQRRRLTNGRGLPPQRDFIRNPWEDDFRGGTRISAGLKLARAMLRRDHVQDGWVVLVSDLAYAAADESKLTRELIDYKRTGTRLRVVPLFPTTEDRELFARMLGSTSFLSWKQLRGVGRAGVKVHEKGALPAALIAIGIIGILLLAINELRCARLVVPRSGRP
jgi:hypothetical protein